MAKKEEWKDITLAQLTGVFDARSRPADLAPGAFRWKQNFAISDTGKLFRRDGHERLFSEFKYDEEGTLCGDDVAPVGACVYGNADMHQQTPGEARELPTLIHVNNNPDSTRSLFVGTETSLYLYGRETGNWTKIASGLGAPGARWKAAGLRDRVLFTNNVDPVKSHELGTTTVANIGELQGGIIKCTAARVIVSFNGFVLVMNTLEDGVRQSARVRWCDLNDSETWTPNPDENVADFQDLDYGDDILAAMPLGGSLLIYTTRSIWRAYIQTSDELVFGFQRLYTEPENSNNCLSFPNTLVSTGDAHYYMSRDGICKWSPYATQPDRVGWIHAASALMYLSSMYPSTAMDASNCEAPVAEYRTKEREIWFSWPTGASGINNHTIACNEQWQTCDYINTGYTAFANYTETADCPAETAVMIGCSGYDWCLKQIGRGIFYREYAGLINDDPSIEIESPQYTAEGYNSILRGEMPLGYPDKKKRVRRVSIDHQTEEQATPCKIRLKIGQSYHIADPNVSSGKDAVLWKAEPPLDLESPDAHTAAQYLANNLKPEEDFGWPVWREARHLFFDFEIYGASGPAVGGDSAWARLTFNARLVAG